MDEMRALHALAKAMGVATGYKDGLGRRVVVSATLDVGKIILLESGLSYLGLGVRAPTPSWGDMILEGKDQLASAPWVAVAPGSRVRFEGRDLLALSERDIRHVRGNHLALLDGLQRELGMAVLLITHYLGIVAERTKRAYVMYAGQVVEEAPTEALYAQPRHPYTEALLSAVPVPDPTTKRPRIVLPGEPPSPVHPPPGCPFHPRCQHPGKDETCRTGRPALAERDAGRVACHKA